MARPQRSRHSWYGAPPGGGSYDHHEEQCERDVRAPLHVPLDLQPCGEDGHDEGQLRESLEQGVVAPRVERRYTEQPQRDGAECSERQIEHGRGDGPPVPRRGDGGDVREKSFPAHPLGTVPGGASRRVVAG